MFKHIHNLYHLRKRRQTLRVEGTSAEAVLWTCLRGKQLQGRKFRRQHSIENMIVDFFCSSEKLVIELDGDDHFTVSGAEKDRKRDERLNLLGYTVLRFENVELLNNLQGVLDDISAHFK